jgi:peptidoglycan/LPS O-acetylase OafA/YrhL
LSEPLTIPSEPTGLAEIAHATTQTPVSASPSRLEFIDALRGFACIWVLLCHVQGYWLDHQIYKTVGLLRALEVVVTGFCRVGIAGVDLFIVLSGFCLYWPVVRGWQKQKMFEPITFFKRRARRIMPAYYVAVLLCSAITLYPPLQRHFVPRPARLIDIASYLGFVMTFVPYRLTTVNGTYWSIALEAQLYICFPLAVWLARRAGLRAVVAVAVVVTGSWQLIQWSGLGHRLGLSEVAYIYHLPARYFEFVAGMVAAECAANPRPRQARWGLLSTLLALPVALYFAKYHITTWSEVIYSAWGIVFAGLILLLSEMPSRWFLQWSRGGLLTRVGIVSYSLYLIHAPLMLLASGSVQSAAIRLHLEPAGVVALFVVIGLPILTMIAYGFYLMFEKPFMNPARRAGSLLPRNPEHTGVAPAVMGAS